MTDREPTAAENEALRARISELSAARPHDICLLQERWTSLVGESAAGPGDGETLPAESSGDRRMVSCFVSADWSKSPAKRSVYLADVRERRIAKCIPPGAGWDLEALLDVAEDLSRDGSVLIGVDVVLGVPEGYWRSVVEERCQHVPQSFVEWLGSRGDFAGFFETVEDPVDWRVDRPWFKVPAGTGGLTTFTSKVEGGMRRRIDVATGAKPLFAVSGIPGTVGSGTREFWKELFPHLSRDRRFAIWPFDGELGRLLKECEVVLCETYPGLAYAAALADDLPTGRIRNAKTDRQWRSDACGCLAQADWVREHRIDIGDLDPLRANDDDFDAHFTAAAVLRCVLEGIGLVDANWTDAKAEGSMLLAGAVEPDRRSSAWMRSAEMSLQRIVRSAHGSDKPVPCAPSRGSCSAEYRCPIPGCERIFRGLRRGWDGHVGLPRLHPQWRPEIDSPEERKRTFCAEFGDWFE